jgi:hypothetical protein
MSYMDTKCPVSGKVRYRDHHAATLRLRSVRRRRSCVPEGGMFTDRVDRSYRCAACSGFHLTSQAARTPLSATATAPEVSESAHLLGAHRQIIDAIHRAATRTQGFDAVTSEGTVSYAC